MALHRRRPGETVAAERRRLGQGIGKTVSRAAKGNKGRIGKNKSNFGKTVSRLARRR